MIPEFWVFIIAAWAAGVVCTFLVVAALMFLCERIEEPMWGMDSKDGCIITLLSLGSWIGFIILIFIIVTDD